MIVVMLQRPEMLGLEEWWGRGYTVVPASLVLAAIREPRIPDDQWDADYQRGKWAETLKTLRGWGVGMVEVQSFGIVVGEFSVEPYLITAKQFALLRYEGAA